jgi:AraC-like DNA-binding protein
MVWDTDRVTLLKSELFQPIEGLSRDVECMRINTYFGNQKLSVKVVPRGLPGIVFQHKDDGTAIESITMRSGHTSDLPALFLHGQGSEPSVMNFAEGPYTIIQVVLKPQGLYSIFGLDASALGGIVPSPEFGAEGLRSQLTNASSHSQCLTLFEDFMVTKLNTSGKRDELVEKSLDFIDSRIATVLVKHVVDFVQLSERQYQKRFARVVGCSPKRYIRIKRVNEALRLMTTGTCTFLADIAHALNFYDQSHFISEIKTFSWLTPTRLSEKISDLVRDQTGTSYL